MKHFRHVPSHVLEGSSYISLNFKKSEPSHTISETLHHDKVRRQNRRPLCQQAICLRLTVMDVVFGPEKDGDCGQSSKEALRTSGCSVTAHAQTCLTDSPMPNPTKGIGLIRTPQNGFRPIIRIRDLISTVEDADGLATHRC
ncbi:hypothetical protein J6590_048305 [Homalodisca vitripennis]|nr:hypothetical protein J6590_048305 [Homalodisca vitripennis]